MVVQIGFLARLWLRLNSTKMPSHQRNCWRQVIMALMGFSSWGKERGGAWWWLMSGPKLICPVGSFLHVRACISGPPALNHFRLRKYTQVPGHRFMVAFLEVTTCPLFAAPISR